MDDVVGDVWRREASLVHASLLLRYGDLGDCEDAAQEAAAAATRQWPEQGIPDDPRAWLIRVASRRLVDMVRTDRARQRRELSVMSPANVSEGALDDGSTVSTGADDTLQLLMLCCHQSLSRSSQVALSLRSVAGLGVAEIAAAYLVPARTMTQRLTRARTTLRAAGAQFTMPEGDELPARIAAVLDVCHLVFAEGYQRTAGESLIDVELAQEAIRLTRQVVTALPDHDEAAGALALMLLTHARAPARTNDRGELVPLSAQDRSRWQPELMAEGRTILERVLPRGPVGRYQLQAAIAAVHADAPTFDATDWPQIVVLYGMLHDVAPSPAVTLNRAVAVAMVDGPEAGLTLLGPLVESPAMRHHHRLFAVRAHLHELAGDVDMAISDYREAARLTTSIPEQRYLNGRIRRLTP